MEMTTPVLSTKGESMEMTTPVFNEKVILSTLKLALVHKYNILFSLSEWERVENGLRDAFKVQ